MSNNTGVVNIRGKEYMTVALRVQKFREAHPEWELSTEIIKADEKVVIMQARIYTENGKCIATGHAEEFRASSQINSTSALENCETSAIGRCLASAGWGGADLQSNWKAAYTASQSDAGFIAAITVAKDRRKAELSAA